MSDFTPAPTYAEVILTDAEGKHPRFNPIWLKWFLDLAALLPGGGAGLGTVTSVAVTVPSEFSLSGSPITTSGTLAITTATQTANRVWAGPTSGAAAQPTFRALVTADMPAGTGTVTSVAQTFTGGIVSVAGSPITTTGTLALTVAGTSGGIPYFSGTTTWASSGALAQGGIVVGGGAGATPTTVAAGATTTILVGGGANTAPVWTTAQGSGAPVRATSPALTTPALGTPTALVLTNATGDQTGTTTNDNAAAGKVGEVISSTIVQASAVSLTTATAADVTSVSLTAGDWDCTGNVGFQFGATTNTTRIMGGLHTTSATTPAADARATMSQSAGFVPGLDIQLSLFTRRFSLSGTTTLYLVAYSDFTLSTNKAYGNLYCRRAR